MSLAQGKDFGPLRCGKPVRPIDPTNPDLASAFGNLSAAMGKKSLPDILEYYDSRGLNMTYRLMPAQLQTNADALKISLDCHFSMTTGTDVLLTAEAIHESTVRATLADERVKRLFAGQGWYDRALKEIEAIKEEGEAIGDGGVLSVKGLHAEVEVHIEGVEGKSVGDYYYVKSGEDGVWRIIWQDCIESGYPPSAIEKMQKMMGQMQENKAKA